MALDGTALTDLETVKDELGIAHSDDDSSLERYIRQASSIFRSVTGQNWNYEEGFTESVPGFHTKRLLVHKHLPVESIDKIELDLGTHDMTITAGEYELEDGEAGFIRNISGGWQLTEGYYDEIEPNYNSEYQQLYKVTYTGGYVTPVQASNTGGDRTLPYDIEDAIIDLVTTKYRQKGRDSNVSSESIMSVSIDYENVAEMDGVIPGTTPHFSRIAKSKMSPNAMFA